MLFISNLSKFVNMKEEKKFVLLIGAESLYRAYLIQSFLESNGIYSWLQDELTLTINPYLLPAFDGYKIMVANDEIDRARELLEEFNANLQKEDLEPDED